MNDTAMVIIMGIVGAVISAVSIFVSRRLGQRSQTSATEPADHPSTRPVVDVATEVIAGRYTGDLERIEEELTEPLPGQALADEFNRDRKR